jgi:hypothetical protein
MSAANPLELIADWLLARYPFEAAAAQLGVSTERDPEPTVLSEPSAETSELEDRLQRELLKAVIAEQNDPGTRVDWSGEPRHSGITLPRISSQLGARVRAPNLLVRHKAGTACSAQPAAAGAAPPPKPARLTNYLFGSGQRFGGWDESKRLAGQQARSDKAAARRDEICRLHDSGMQQTQIALVLGISEVTTWRALRAHRNGQ